MAIGDDFSIAANGDIRYTGSAHEASGAGYYTVLEFHRWLQDLADNASSSGDDNLDITDTTPSERSTDNIVTLIDPYNITATEAEHLYDGSVIQDGGDDVWDGIVNYGTRGIHIEIIQNGALIANDFWNSTPFGESDKGLNFDVSKGISHRFLIQVRTGGSDTDGKRLIGIAREFEWTYDEFKIAGTNNGNNTLALSHTDDLNNETAATTVQTWTTITNTPGYQGIDADGDSTDEYYYSEWDFDTYSVNQFYERLKWITRRGTAETFYGLDAGIFRGITHQITYTSLTGTFDHSNPVTFGNGATAQVLADNGTDTFWVQLLTGVAPPTSNSITQSAPDAASATTNVITERPLSIPFCGQSTGSAIIGAYGLGITESDLTSADKVTDLTNTQNEPPNNVTFDVKGLVSTEDRVLVGPWDGVSTDNQGFPIPDYDQLSADGAYSGGETTFTVVEDIPGDTPTTGTIRIYDGTNYARATYTGWSGKSFTGCSGVPACSDLADVWISYIDKMSASGTESFTGVYQSDRDLVIRVRDGASGSPIKTFATSGVLGSNGGDTTVIRTPDA